MQPVVFEPFYTYTDTFQTHWDEFNPTWMRGFKMLF